MEGLIKEIGIRPNPTQLIWTAASPANKQCCYDHTTAQTPFGRFLLTWKSWKEYPDFGFDETPWGEVEYRGWGSIEEAQQWGEAELERRARAILNI